MFNGTLVDPHAATLGPSFPVSAGQPVRNPQQPRQKPANQTSNFHQSPAARYHHHLSRNVVRYPTLSPRAILFREKFFPNGRKERKKKIVAATNSLAVTTTKRREEKRSRGGWMKRARARARSRTHRDRRGTEDCQSIRASRPGIRQLGVVTFPEQSPHHPRPRSASAPPLPPHGAPPPPHPHPHAR